TLSPGERTRAELAAQAALGANCLVLDEPTNHLDLPAIEELERALAAYAGTLLLVTHDPTLPRAGRRRPDFRPQLAILRGRMAVPKKKTSKSRRDKRRAQPGIESPRVNVCPTCGQPK